MSSVTLEQVRTEAARAALAAVRRLGFAGAWADITGKPTTLSGFGITDGASDAELAAHESDTTNVHGIANTANLSLNGHTHAQSDVTNLATDLAAKQPLDADLTALAALGFTSLVQDSLVYWTGGIGSPTFAALTSAGRDLINDANAGAQRVTLGLGNSATLNVGTAAGTVAAGDDSRFANPEGWNVIVKPANEDVVNAGNTADSDFTFPVVAGGHYAVWASLIVSGDNTTADYGMNVVHVTAGTMKGKGTCQNLNASAAAQNIIVTAAGAAQTTGIACGVPTADIDDLTFIDAKFAFTASNDATARYRFGNSTPTVGATSRTWKGSVYRWKRID